MLLTDFLKPGRIFFRNKWYEPDEIMAGINSVAEYLSTHCDTSSPFVFLFAPNHIKTVLAYFGCIKANKICILVDPAIGRLELAEMTAHTPPAASIKIDKQTTPFDYANEIQIHKLSNPLIHWHELDDVCTMLYHNAADGWAKPVMLTNKNLLANAHAVHECCEIGPGTVSCAAVSICFLFGMQVGAIAPAIIGGDSVIVDVEILTSGSKVASIIKQAGITDFYSIPAEYYLLSKADDVKNHISTVKSFISGAYKLPDRIFNTFLAKTGREIHEGYGLTEGAPICAFHRPNDPIRNGSVGRAFSCCEISIDATGSPDKSIGEVAVKGTNITTGYYGFPETTQQCLRNGWLYTGDLGCVDNEGFLFLTGLKKNMYNVGGKKVYPAEVERLIRSNTNVDSISITAKTDLLFCQQLHGTVHLYSDTLKDREVFLAWGKENLSPYKFPSRFEFC